MFTPTKRDVGSGKGRDRYILTLAVQMDLTEPHSTWGTDINIQQYIEKGS